MTAFCIQEFIISTVYLLETVKILKTSYHEKRRKVMYQLIFVNTFIIVIDLALLGVEYASLYTLETTLKGIVYSIKLRLEFAVLNQLVAFTRAPRSNSVDGTTTTADKPDFDVGLFKLASNTSVQPREKLRDASPFSNSSAGAPPSIGASGSPAAFADSPRAEAAEVPAIPDSERNRNLRKDSWIQDFAYRASDG